MRLLENFTFGVNGVHKRTPEGIEKLRLGPNVLHKNLEGMKHLQNWANKANARREHGIFRPTQLERKANKREVKRREVTRKKDIHKLISMRKKG
jgi:hypothetical protein